ncbi:MAG: MBL fold metallo-hydrolase [Gemmatimonadota bacterium]
MILKRLYDQKLAQASYLIGCGQSGEAAVFDPNRDIEQYVDLAAAEGLRITHVTETHIHADFVSGSRELAQRTGATLYLSDEGGPDWRYRYAGEAGATLLKDGDGFRVGNIQIDAMHTPGHTPEHMAFMVTDTAAATAPIGIVTGDFVFVGDVGRPDLLEKAANVQGTMDAAARTLFASLQKFRKLPDYLQIWPGHGAGSACGKGLSSVPHSTVGYERLFNWALAATSEDEFVEQVLAGQPEPPKYFAEMKRINKEGPRILNGFGHPPRLPPTRLDALLEEGALVVDTRSAAAYAAAHIPRTLSIPLNRSFTTWAGWLIPYISDVYLILDDQESGKALGEAVRDLAMIGLDRVGGAFGAGAVEAWAERDGGLEVTPQMSVQDLAQAMKTGKVLVVDVRGRSEWEAGHIPGVENIPLGFLGDRADELSRDRQLVVHCQSGGRSAMGASVLQGRGFRNVANLVGGFAAWEGAGFEVDREQQLPSHS